MADTQFFLAYFTLVGEEDIREELRRQKWYYSAQRLLYCIDDDTKFKL